MMARQLKHRVVVDAPPAVSRLAGSPPAANVHVVATKVGAVTVLDKVKAYYKTLIAIVAAVVVFLNQVTPIADFLPVQYRHWFSTAVVVVGAVAVFLKANEHWIDGGTGDAPPEAA